MTRLRPFVCLLAFLAPLIPPVSSMPSWCKSSSDGFFKEKAREFPEREVASSCGEKFKSIVLTSAVEIIRVRPAHVLVMITPQSSQR
jgi:hypothetical protein